MAKEVETENPAVISERESRIQEPQSTILRPLALAFRAGVELRIAAYRRGWLKTRRLDRPVISVGNLTAGGTGKTPLVEWLAKTLIRRERKPSILTRGYGRRRGAELLVIEPGFGRDPDPRAVGDEPALLATALPEVPIIVGADRYQAGRIAEDRFGVDVHLLDDGFSHLALERDVDMVILDSTEELSDQALLPAGRLREPFSALTRADFVILTRTELSDPRALEARVRRIGPQASIFRGRTSLYRLVEVQSGGTLTPGALQGRPVYAFCGIGNPGSFFRNLAAWGFSAAGQQSFRDHHVYSASELKLLGARARDLGAMAMLTTEKDAMIFPAVWHSEVPVVWCAIQTEIGEAQAFEDAVLARLESGSRGMRI